jgi:argininosuccinate lyase
VTQRLGDLCAKLHAGRSRNDLVMTDLRLWLLDAHRRIEEGLVRLVRATIAHAADHTDTVMPGTTHGRLAQPVTLGHHLLAHGWALCRDVERFADWRGRANISPLGAGALATSTLDLDAARTAERLGFARSFDNSIDAVSDRDVVHGSSPTAICSTHTRGWRRSRALVGRVGWLGRDRRHLLDGRSMMPQAEPRRLRAGARKGGRVLGDLVSLSAVLHGLPLGYHRDLQEDKEVAFDAADTLETTLAAIAGCVETITFRPEAMRAATRVGGLYATDLAEALVRTGVPFREAHRRVGELLRRLEAEGLSFIALSPDDWATLGLPDGAALLDADRAVRARAAPAGPRPRAFALRSRRSGAACRPSGERSDQARRSRVGP